ncbi:hypothetical protein GW17_00000266 [Ensete ventricosum]|nr:hypothetical protein GW17_00000266 [Ensete ventricosum]RZS19495.1 hypothetical protein BHM03_00051892 [Ensete ventricosum]
MVSNAHLGVISKARCSAEQKDSKALYSWGFFKKHKEVVYMVNLWPTWYVSFLALLTEDSP